MARQYHSMKVGQRVVYLTATGEKRKGKVSTLHANEDKATVLPEGYSRGRKPVSQPGTLYLQQAQETMAAYRHITKSQKTYQLNLRKIINGPSDLFPRVFFYAQYRC